MVRMLCTMSLRVCSCPVVYLLGLEPFLLSVAECTYNLTVQVWIVFYLILRGEDH